MQNAFQWSTYALHTRVSLFAAILTLAVHLPQKNDGRFIFEKTAADRTVYKFIMIATTVTIGLVGVAVGQMATGTVRWFCPF